MSIPRSSSHMKVYRWHTYPPAAPEGEPLDVARAIDTRSHESVYAQVQRLAHPLRHVFLERLAALNAVAYELGQADILDDPYGKLVSRVRALLPHAPAELRARSFWEVPVSPLRELGADCLGTPQHVWNAHTRAGIQENFVGRRETFAVRDRATQGPLLGTGLDPSRNWGVIRETAPDPSGLSSRPILLNQFYACCGRPVGEEGCWSGEQKGVIQPYELATNFDPWDDLRDMTEQEFEQLWMTSGKQGSVWVDEAFYARLHARIQTLKQLLGPVLFQMRRYVIEQTEKTPELFFTINPMSLLESAPPETRAAFDELVSLQNKYNEPHCVGTTLYTAPDWLFHMGTFRKLMENRYPELLSVIFTPGKDAPAEEWDAYYDRVLERYTLMFPLFSTIQIGDTESQLKWWQRSSIFFETKRRHGKIPRAFDLDKITQYVSAFNSVILEPFENKLWRYKEDETRLNTLFTAIRTELRDNPEDVPSEYQIRGITQDDWNRIQGVLRAFQKLGLTFLDIQSLMSETYVKPLNAYLKDPSNQTLLAKLLPVVPFDIAFATLDNNLQILYDFINGGHLTRILDIVRLKEAGIGYYEAFFKGYVPPKEKSFADALEVYEERNRIVRDYFDTKMLKKNPKLGDTFRVLAINNDAVIEILSEFNKKLSRYTTFWDAAIDFLEAMTRANIILSKEIMTYVQDVYDKFKRDVDALLNQVYRLEYAQKAFLRNMQSRYEAKYQSDKEEGTEELRRGLFYPDDIYRLAIFTASQMQNVNVRDIMRRAQQLDMFMAHQTVDNMRAVLQDALEERINQCQRALLDLLDIPTVEGVDEITLTPSILEQFNKKCNTILFGLVSMTKKASRIFPASFADWNALTQYAISVGFLANDASVAPWVLYEKVPGEPLDDVFVIPYVKQCPSYEFNRAILAVWVAIAGRLKSLVKFTPNQNLATDWKPLYNRTVLDTLRQRAQADCDADPQFAFPYIQRMVENVETLNRYRALGIVQSSMYQDYMARIDQRERLYAVTDSYIAETIIDDSDNALAQLDNYLRGQLRDDINAINTERREMLGTLFDSVEKARLFDTGVDLIPLFYVWQRARNQNAEIKQAESLVAAIREWDRQNRLLDTYYGPAFLYSVILRERGDALVDALSAYFVNNTVLPSGQNTPLDASVFQKLQSLITASTLTRVELAQLERILDKFDEDETLTANERALLAQKEISDSTESVKNALETRDAARLFTLNDQENSLQTLSALLRAQEEKMTPEMDFETFKEAWNMFVIPSTRINELLNIVYPFTKQTAEVNMVRKVFSWLVDAKLMRADGEKDKLIFAFNPITVLTETNRYARNVFVIPAAMDAYSKLDERLYITVKLVIQFLSTLTQELFEDGPIDPLRLEYEFDAKYVKELYPLLMKLQRIQDFAFNPDPFVRIGDEKRQEMTLKMGEFNVIARRFGTSAEYLDVTQEQMLEQENASLPAELAKARDYIFNDILVWFNDVIYENAPPEKVESLTAKAERIIAIDEEYARTYPTRSPAAVARQLILCYAELIQYTLNLFEDGMDPAELRESADEIDKCIERVSLTMRVVECARETFYFTGSEQQIRENLRKWNSECTVLFKEVADDMSDASRTYFYEILRALGFVTVESVIKYWIYGPLSDSGRGIFLIPRTDAGTGTTQYNAFEKSVWDAFRYALNVGLFLMRMQNQLPQDSAGYLAEAERMGRNIVRRRDTVLAVPSSAPAEEEDESLIEPEPEEEDEDETEEVESEQPLRYTSRDNSDPLWRAVHEKIGGGLADVGLFHVIRKYGFQSENNVDKIIVIGDLDLRTQFQSVLNLFYNMVYYGSVSAERNLTTQAPGLSERQKRVIENVAKAVDMWRELFIPDSNGSKLVRVLTMSIRSTDENREHIRLLDATITTPPVVTIQAQYVLLFQLQALFGALDTVLATGTENLDDIQNRLIDRYNNSLQSVVASTMDIENRLRRQQQRPRTRQIIDGPTDDDSSVPARALPTPTQTGDWYVASSQERKRLLDCADSEIQLGGTRAGGRTMLTFRFIADSTEKLTRNRLTELNDPTNGCVYFVVSFLREHWAQLGSVQQEYISRAGQRVGIVWNAESDPPVFIQTVKAIGTNLFDSPADNNNNVSDALYLPLESATNRGSNMRMREFLAFGEAWAHFTLLLAQVCRVPENEFNVQQNDIERLMELIESNPFDLPNELNYARLKSGADTSQTKRYPKPINNGISYALLETRAQQLDENLSEYEKLGVPWDYVNTYYIVPAIRVFQALRDTDSVKTYLPVEVQKHFGLINQYANEWVVSTGFTLDAPPNASSDFSLGLYNPVTHEFMPYTQTEQLSLLRQWVELMRLLYKIQQHQNGAVFSDISALKFKTIAYKPWTFEEDPKEENTWAYLLRSKEDITMPGAITV